MQFVVESGELFLLAMLSVNYFMVSGTKRIMYYISTVTSRGRLVYSMHDGVKL